MDKTISYYNDNAIEFAQGTLNADMSDSRQNFLSYVKSDGKILDAGCGSGRDSLAFIDAGYDVVAMDASEKLCRIASHNIGQEILCVRFEDVDFESEFDGIWACASLLHVKKSDMKNVLQKLHKALKLDGVMYVSFKYGENERESNGRFFNDYTEESLKLLMKTSGFEVLEIYVTEDVRADRVGEKWVNGIVRK